jgi:hypothetical protein
VILLLCPFLFALCSDMHHGICHVIGSDEGASLSLAAQAWQLRSPERLATCLSPDNVSCRGISSTGYRERPIPFPAAGLLMSAGERYDAVCDFSQVPGATLYLANGRNT